MSVSSVAAPGAVIAQPVGRTRAGSILAYCRRNPHLVVGSAMVLALILIGLLGPLVVDVKLAQPINSIPDQRPGPGNLLGTDDQGRDMLAVLVAGLPLTLRIGFIAGAV